VWADRVVSVHDHGEGIPAELQEQMFEKVWRVSPSQFSRPRGRGLGLTFCRLAVEAHGGVLDVQSTPGGGTTFAFSLPRTAQTDQS
jgi:signal transduction histidine kinase